MTDAKFMIGSQTSAIRGITSFQGIEVTPGLLRRLFGGTSTFAIILKTAAGEMTLLLTPFSDPLSNEILNTRRKLFFQA